ncbi:MAG: membrane dipeptidase [Eubacteriales bacterium]|nr:membrane dipeptidase [Eubacteriales bacterium]
MKYFDLHCDTLFAIAQEGGTLRKRGGQVDLDRARKYEPYAQVFALFCGAEPLDDPAQAHVMFTTLLRTAQEQFAANADGLMYCRTAADFDRACDAGKVAAFLSVEGAELLQWEEDICAAIDAGVRVVTLSWNHDSCYACGAARSRRKGITERGKALVKRLDQAGIFLDVSHLSERGFWDLTELTERPILATHSNSRAIRHHVRNLKDDQFREICRRGGLTGLNCYVPFVTPNVTASVRDLFPHIDHFMELGGEYCLAIGADFDGCDRLPDEIHSVADMDCLAEEMRRHGYSEECIRNLFFENAARFVREYF